MYHMIAPGSHFAPAVQNGNFFHTIRSGSLDILIQCTEFFANGFDIFYKIRELKCKFQISPITNSLNRAAQDCSSCCYPVDLCFFDRITTLMECIRKEIWQKSSFGIFYMLDVTEES